MSNEANSRPVRIDPNFEKLLGEISIERIKKDLEKETLSPREITRMMLNAPSINKIKEELTSLPRKKKNG